MERQRKRITNTSRGEAPSADRVDLTYDAYLVLSLDGRTYLSFGGHCYLPQDRLPPQLSGRWQWSAVNARQFVAQCMLLRFGNEVDKWPMPARTFIDIIDE